MNAYGALDFARGSEKGAVSLENASAVIDGNVGGYHAQPRFNLETYVTISS
jgi:hypothetical protein